MRLKPTAEMKLVAVALLAFLIIGGSAWVATVALAAKKGIADEDTTTIETMREGSLGAKVEQIRSRLSRSPDNPPTQPEAKPVTIHPGNGDLVWYRLPLPKSATITALARGEKEFVALEYDPGSSRGKVIDYQPMILWTSTDGVQWKKEKTARLPFTSCAKLIFAKGLFVAVGKDKHQPVLMTSTDRRRWTERVRPKRGELHQFHDVSFLNGRFIAAGIGGRVYTSRDGEIWKSTKFSGSPGCVLKSIAWGNGVYLAAGDNTTITSSDAEKWTSVKSIGPGWGPRDVFHIGDRFVMLSHNRAYALQGDELAARSHEWGLRFVAGSRHNKEVLVMTENKSLLSTRNGMNWTRRGRVMAAPEGYNANKHAFVILDKSILSPPQSSVKPR